MAAGSCKLLNITCIFLNCAQQNFFPCFFVAPVRARSRLTDQKKFELHLQWQEYNRRTGIWPISVVVTTTATSQTTQRHPTARIGTSSKKKPRNFAFPKQTEKDLKPLVVKTDFTCKHCNETVFFFLITNTIEMLLSVYSIEFITRFIWKKRSNVPKLNRNFQRSVPPGKRQ